MIEGTKETTKDLVIVHRKGFHSRPAVVLNAHFCAACGRQENNWVPGDGFGCVWVSVGRKSMPPFSDH